MNFNELDRTSKNKTGKNVRSYDNTFIETEYHVSASYARVPIVVNRLYQVNQREKSSNMASPDDRELKFRITTAHSKNLFSSRISAKSPATESFLCPKKSAPQIAIGKQTNNQSFKGNTSAIHEQKH